jgi:hypothetical protein
MTMPNIWKQCLQPTIKPTVPPGRDCSPNSSLAVAIGRVCSESDNCWGSVVVSFCCQKLVAEVKDLQELRGREMSAIGSLYQAMAVKM